MAQNDAGLWLFGENFIRIGPATKMRLLSHLYIRRGEGEKMKHLKLTMVLLTALTLGMLSGCGGGGSKVTSTTTTTTMGQELQDLDASYQKGIITEKQYNKAKDNILKKYK